MLPSFRLIAATFLCGFFVVFAGLRLAASLNDIHEGLPVMAAHAAPVSITPVADREARRSLAAVPVMYDLRFAVSTVAPTLVRVPPTVLDQPAPPLSIVPPDDVRQGNSLTRRRAEPAKDATTSGARSHGRGDPARRAGHPGVGCCPRRASRAAGDGSAGRRRHELPGQPDTTAEHPAAETPAPVTQAAANEPQATPAPAIEESAAQPGSRCPGRAPAAPQRIPSPSRVRPLPRSQPRNPKLPSHRPRNPRRASRSRSRARSLSVSPAAPRRRSNPFGSSNRRTFATLPGIAQR